MTLRLPSLRRLCNLMWLMSPSDTFLVRLFLLLLLPDRLPLLSVPKLFFFDLRRFLPLSRVYSSLVTLMMKSVLSEDSSIFVGFFFIVKNDTMLSNSLIFFSLSAFLEWRICFLSFSLNSKIKSAWHLWILLFPKAWSDRSRCYNFWSISSRASQRSSGNSAVVDTLVLVVPWYSYTRRLTSSANYGFGNWILYITEELASLIELSEDSDQDLIKLFDFVFLVSSLNYLNLTPSMSSSTLLQICLFFLSGAVVFGTRPLSSLFDSSLPSVFFKKFIGTIEYLINIFLGFSQ